MIFDKEPMAQLRRRAEVALGATPSDAAARAIYELRVHQTELEMQNEELRQSQADLAASQELYRDLYEYAPVGYLTLDPRGEISRANLTAAALLGTERANLVGSNLHALLSADEAGKLHLHLRDALHSREPRVCEVALKGKTGLIHLRLDTAPVFAEVGSHHYRVILTDVSDCVHAERMLAELNENLEQRVQERKSALEASEKALGLESAARTTAQQQLLVAQKMEAVGRLAGGVAHELNNTLQVIFTAAGLLRESCSGPQMTLLEQLDQAAETAGSLGKQLLLLTKQRTLSRNAVNLVPVLAAIETLLLRALDERVTLSVTVDEDEDEAWIAADRSQVEQVLLNLTLNASDAMPAGGELAIRCTCLELRPEDLPKLPKAKVGVYAKISVIDNGTGMDEETQSHAFEPFYTTKEIGEGKGLGLANVYGTISRCGGFITVDSQPGKGSCFDLYLPRVERPVDVDQAPSPVDTAPAKKARILLVEDQARILRVVRRILTQHGYEVSAACDGARALRVVEEADQAFDLLLTDVRMPGMGGKDLANRIRSLSPSTRVIYMSGYSADENFDEGFAFLPKPFTNQELLASIDAALDTEV